MTYIDGFVAAVPQENKQAYLDHVREALSLFKDHGATRMVENWGDDAFSRVFVPAMRTFFDGHSTQP